VPRPDSSDPLDPCRSSDPLDPCRSSHPDNLSSALLAHPNPHPFAEPHPVSEPHPPSTTPVKQYRLAVSGAGHGGIRGNLRNHDDPGELLRRAADLVDVGTFESGDPETLRRRAAEVRLATAFAMRLEDSALELRAAEEEAAIVRRRIQRSEKAYRRRTDLEAKRAAGGLYAGQRRSPNRPTHVEVDDSAWNTLKARAARRGRSLGEFVGDLVAAAAAAGLPPERRSERRTERALPSGRTTGRVGRRASRYARLFLPDDETWPRFRAQAVDASVSTARAVGLVVEHEARRLGWRPETGK
jgi:hypothetical protein